MAHLIDKDALVAEIERKIEAHKETLKNTDSSISEMVLKGSMSAYQNLLHFLYTLEVKEVDLENEIHLWMVENSRRGYFSANISETAKHFFELGIKTKGE